MNRSAVRLDAEPLMTTADVAALTKFDRRTIITAALAGELEHYEFGGSGRGIRYRFARAAVNRWLESKRVAA